MNSETRRAIAAAEKYAQDYFSNSLSTRVSLFPRRNGAFVYKHLEPIRRQEHSVLVSALVGADRHVLNISLCWVNGFPMNFYQDAMFRLLEMPQFDDFSLEIVTAEEVGCDKWTGELKHKQFQEPCIRFQLFRVFDYNAILLGFALATAARFEFSVQSSIKAVRGKGFIKMPISPNRGDRQNWRPLMESDNGGILPNDLLAPELDDLTKTARVCRDSQDYLRGIDFTEGEFSQSGNSPGFAELVEIRRSSRKEAGIDCDVIKASRRLNDAAETVLICGGWAEGLPEGWEAEDGFNYYWASNPVVSVEQALSASGTRDFSQENLSNLGIIFSFYRVGQLIRRVTQDRSSLTASGCTLKLLKAVHVKLKKAVQTNAGKVDRPLKMMLSLCTLREFEIIARIADAIDCSTITEAESILRRRDLECLPKFTGNSPPLSANAEEGKNFWLTEAVTSIAQKISPLAYNLMASNARKISFTDTEALRNSMLIDSAKSALFETILNAKLLMLSK
jgi:hypothetical protein